MKIRKKERQEWSRRVYGVSRADQVDEAGAEGVGGDGVGVVQVEVRVLEGVGRLVRAVLSRKPPPSLRGSSEEEKINQAFLWIVDLEKEWRSCYSAKVLSKNRIV